MQLSLVDWLMPLSRKRKQKEAQSKTHVLAHFLISPADLGVPWSVIFKSAVRCLLAGTEHLTTRKFSKMARWESGKTEDQPFLCLLVPVSVHFVLL